MPDQERTPASGTTRARDVARRLAACDPTGLIHRARPIVVAAYGQLVDRVWDRRHGTDTRGPIPLEYLEIASPDRSHGVRYEPTRAGPFLRLMRRLRLPATGAFVDFGCGKGRALMLAARAGFPSVVGVEFSPALCEIARRNLATYASRTGSPAHHEVHCADATTFPIDANHTVFYLFNPFDDVVLARVAANIAASVRRHPRRAWVVYANPVSRTVLDREDLFALDSDHSIGWWRFAVYRVSAPGSAEDPR